jgi:hypothetical protein
MTGKWWALVVWSVLVVATFLLATLLTGLATLGWHPFHRSGTSDLSSRLPGELQREMRADEDVATGRLGGRANQTTRPHLAMTRFHSRAAARTAGR